MTRVFRRPFYDDDKGMDDGRTDRTARQAEADRIAAEDAAYLAQTEADYLCSRCGGSLGRERCHACGAPA
jgi:hypothetical protein